jgi:cell division cycle protein 20 (cofactor of APC complex)
VLVIALGSAVYLWDNADGSIVKLMSSDASSNSSSAAIAGCDVTSVAWSPCATRLLVGTSRATVELWDTVALKRVSEFAGHSARIGALAWASASGCSSGARSGEIRHHDTRAPGGTVALSRAHSHEVCGLKWSCAAAGGGGLASGGLGGPSGARLASGGNDNCLNIWDERRLDKPELVLRKHTAAVKALAWAPWQRHLLASGGGASDRMIRFWNGATGQCLHAVDSHSQVCALQWSRHDKELVSSHGWSANQLVLWRYPTMTKLAELSGHTSRVLHLATSPDGTTVASAGADETLRFWKLFDDRRKGEADEIDLKRGIGGGSVRTTIR